MTNETAGTASPTADQTPPGIPRWVKYILIGIATILVVSIVVMLAMGGEHGPGRRALGSSAVESIAIA